MKAQAPEAKKQEERTKREVCKAKNISGSLYDLVWYLGRVAAR